MSINALIIGGGLIGMLTARSLQRVGYRVSIIDKGALGGEASWAAGGILSPLYPWKQNKAAYALMQEGQQQFPKLVTELIQQTNIDSELIRSGLIILDKEEKSAALKWAEQNHEQIEFLTHELHQLLPNLSCYFDEAIYLPNVRQVRPPRLIQALKKDLLLQNISIIEHREVKKFIFEANNVCGIQTDTQSICADIVVICSGAWTASLLQKQLQEKIDIKPVRGQMLLYKTNKPIHSQIVLRQGTYIIPRKDGHVLCGSTVEDVGFNKDVTSEAVAQLHNIACEIFPEFLQQRPIKHWAALRPGTSRDVPYICPHPDVKGLYFNCGHFRYGIVMSIASAQMITELINNSMTASQTAAYAC